MKKLFLLFAFAMGSFVVCQAQDQAEIIESSETITYENEQGEKIETTKPILLFGEETHDVLWVRKQLDVLFKLVDPSVELELEGDSKLFHSRRPVEECLEVLGVVSLVDVHDERWLLPLHHDEHVEGLLFASQSVIGVRGDTGDSVERRQHLTELLEDLELVMAIRVEHQHQLLERFKGCSLQSVVMIVR